MIFSKKLRRIRRRGKNDYLIIFCLIFLVVVGIVILSSASSNIGKTKFDDSYYYLKHQLMFGFSIGLLGFFIGSFFYYRYLEKIAVPMLLFSIFLLALVFTPLGIQAGGAERWLELGPISFQPSEILKISLVVYLAAWLSKRRDRVSSFTRGLLPLLVVVGTISFLLLKQPSTTSAAIFIAISMIVYFVSGARPLYIVTIVLMGLLVLGATIYLTPYRWERIQAFLNPEANLQTSGYHINQALIAIGSGGWWGVGYGQSNAKILYLPEPIGDSIFVIIAEELGFVGVLAVIGIFALLVMRIFLIAGKARDKFGQLLLIGFGSLIAIQVFINIASISGVIPLTGAPLPFISYGGTALAVFMTIAGIINNVSKYS